MLYAATGGGPLIGPPLLQRLRRVSTLDVALADQTVLVTGASSGIGHAVAQRAAAAGARVVLVARSMDKLAELEHAISAAGGSARAYVADLSVEASCQQLLESLARDGVIVDVLINNAGRSIRRPIDASFDRLHDYRRTMALNYFGALQLTLGLLPGMRERRRGHVINVSSAGVQTGTPLFSAYIASKAALDAFSRIASTELRRDGIRFSTVYMPLVRTAMIEPTAEYRDAPALSPAQAAELVLRPLTTDERQLGTRFAALLSLAHAIAPAAIEGLLGGTRAV